MSEICLFHLKKHSMEYEGLESLSRELIAMSLRHGKIAFHFHSQGCADDLIREAEMKSYFFLSDSYLYAHHDSLDTCDYDPEGNLLFKEWFYEKFSYFSETLRIIKSYPVEELEIFITDNCADCLKDYTTIQTSWEHFLDSLYAWARENEESNPCGFHPARFLINP